MLTAQYTQCLLQTQLALGQRGVAVCLDLLGNESLITRARNLLTKRFMMSGASHLLFIDADITWSPEAVLRLLQKDEPVVTGVYPKKYIDWTNVETKLKAGGAEPVSMMGLDYNINVASKEVVMTEGFAEVLDAATGFMLIKREAVQQLYERYKDELFVVNDLIGAQKTIADYIAIFDCMIDPDTRRSLSEDFAFSRRWQRLGGRVFADLAMPLGHTGGFHYEGDFAARLAAGGGGGGDGGDAYPEGEHQQLQADGRKNVLLAMVPNSSGQFSLNFVLSVTRAVQALGSRQDVRVQIKTVASKDAACDYLWNDACLDTAVIADGSLGFEPALLLDMVGSKSPLAAAVYPEADMSWDRVADMQGAEAPRTRGLSYACEKWTAGRQAVDGRMEVEACALGFCKIDKCVLERVRSRLPRQATWAQGRRCLWFNAGTRDDRPLSDDEMFCMWWGAGVTLHTASPLTRLGNMTFTGCVLSGRHQLR